MSRMVDDLFELSRLEAGVFEINPMAVPLRDLVSEAVAGADPIARARGVRLTGAVELDTLVDVDPAGFRRVLLNLLTNAIRHTPPRRGGARSTPGAVVTGSRSASTTPAGASPTDDLPRVFDLAWRGSAARSPEEATGSGAGLGLAIVKGIVEAHSGTVSVANHDPGCRFRGAGCPAGATAAG